MSIKNKLVIVEMYLRNSLVHCHRLRENTCDDYIFKFHFSKLDSYLTYTNSDYYFYIRNGKLYEYDTYDNMYWEY